MVLIKYSGKYVKIYFNMKITFSVLSDVYSASVLRLSYFSWGFSSP